MYNQNLSGWNVKIQKFFNRHFCYSSTNSINGIYHVALYVLRTKRTTVVISQDLKMECEFVESRFPYFYDNYYEKKNLTVIITLYTFRYNLCNISRHMASFSFPFFSLFCLFVFLYHFYCSIFISFLFVHLFVSFSIHIVF